MSDTALTKDPAIRGHLRPVNLQVWVDDGTDWGVLGNYLWDIGLSDYDGAIIYDWKKTRVGDLKTVNEQGAIIFPKVMVDMRGGALTVVGTKSAAGASSNPESPSLLMQSARFGRLTAPRVLFQVSPVRAAETDTSNSPTNKVTVGGKGGVNYGIGSGEISGSVEHGFQSGSVAQAFQGRLLGVTLTWTAK